MITRITAEVKLRAAGGEEEAVVRWLREGARGGGEPRQCQEVRGLQGDAGVLWAAGGGKDGPVVRGLRKGAHEGGEHRQQEVRGLWREAAKLRTTVGKEAVKQPNFI